MYISNGYPNYSGLFSRYPQAIARIKGSREYSDVEGTVRFYTTPKGTLVTADIEGLPMVEGKCGGGIFGFHIHEGTDCGGNDTDPFADTRSHYDPKGCPHPYHAGDMPPLFETGGYAFLAFLTGRFNVKEILGRTVVIHSDPDDFASQPSGNAGQKIACGVIERK